MNINNKDTIFFDKYKLNIYKNYFEQLGKQKFILKYSKELGADLALIVNQIELEKKLIKKLPTWLKAGSLFTKRSAEQATSEQVALYKATLIKGDKILVLAGGLGVDEWAFSNKCKHIDSVDCDVFLNKINKHNLEALRIDNINRITDTAESFILNTAEQYDLIYIDPDRRDEKGKQISLKEHQPNVISLLPEMKKLSNEIWIKCSPMYDIEMAKRELNGIEEIYCISEKGEVKELLIKVGKSNVNIRRISVDIESEAISVNYYENECGKTIDISNEIGGYLYEMGAAIMKADIHKPYAIELNLKAINFSTPFYIGENITSKKYIGKIYKIEAVFGLSEFIKYCKKNKIKAVQAKVRGVAKMNTEQFYKKCQLAEGGELIVRVTTYQNSLNIILVKKID